MDLQRGLYKLDEICENSGREASSGTQKWFVSYQSMLGKGKRERANSSTKVVTVLSRYANSVNSSTCDIWICWYPIHTQIKITKTVWLKPNNKSGYRKMNPVWEAVQK